MYSPLIQSDFYKQSHYKMYPKEMTLLYSNFTPRKSRIKGVNEVVVFGIQYFIKEYLLKQWEVHFFSRKKTVVINEFKTYMDCTLGKDSVATSHWEQLHDLGYLPLEIKALPEGSLCPVGVPCITIKNTHPDFGWLVNFLETIISCNIWQPMTSATIARKYRQIFERYAIETTGSDEFVQWQGHDFSMRGLSSLESSASSGAGHLLFFTGTDTIPAILFHERYYNADVRQELIGASVPATEHSVMCVGTKDDEIGTFERLIDSYPTGILSIVSDTWDLWKVCAEYLPALKDKILGRDGKIVIRPDSGDPVNILCGDDSLTDIGAICERMGVIELLWNVFGGTTTDQGYKVLDPHIGAIYGDSITFERAEQICERLKQKGFASTNVVFGIGSYTYQNNTRDTFGFACKATYAELGNESREIYKDPITDDGTKKSAKGLIAVFEDELGRYEKVDQVDWATEQKGALTTVFKDGKLIKEYSLSEIRQRCLTKKEELAPL